MKVKHIITTCGILLGGLAVSQNAGAVVTYETNSDVQFTFNPILSLTLYGGDFIIPDLLPDTSKDSNVVTATVKTNNLAGYELSATVGNTTYNSTSLISSNNDTIAMMSSGTSLSSGTWGYTLDGGTTYGALDTTNSTLLKNTVDPEDSDTTIQIGAYAAANQAAGGYRNVINFVAVATPVLPIDTVPNLQAFAYMTVAQKTEVIDSMENDKTYAIPDARDNKTYNIAKLKDGQVWMTSNLNLAGDTTLNASTSDVPTDNYYTLPASSTSGFLDSSVAYVYNSGNETTSQSGCTNSTPCNSYYSWLAATAGGKDASGNNVTGDGYNAAYSICPKGWRLPTATTSDANPQQNNNWKTGDFYRLATAYGANLESSYFDSSATFYNNAGPGTTPNFLLAGLYDSIGLHYAGSIGGYWASSSNSSTRAYYLSIDSSTVVDSAYDYYRYSGLPVRCMLR